jgi:hypothetical protein
MTRLEREIRRLKGGWSQYSLGQAQKRIDRATAATEEFTAANGREAPICTTSLALVIDELYTRLDDVEIELANLRRTVES